MGQTEASVDVARLARLNASGVICEIMNEDGTMARLPDLERFGAEHKIRIVTVADIIRWRLRTETLVEVEVEAPITVKAVERIGAIKFFLRIRHLITVVVGVSIVADIICVCVQPLRIVETENI